MFTYKNFVPSLSYHLMMNIFQHCSKKSSVSKLRLVLHQAETQRINKNKYWQTENKYFHVCPLVRQNFCAEDKNESNYSLFAIIYSYLFLFILFIHYSSLPINPGLPVIKSLQLA